MDTDGPPRLGKGPFRIWWRDDEGRKKYARHTSGVIKVFEKRRQINQYMRNHPELVDAGAEIEEEPNA